MGVQYAVSGPLGPIAEEWILLCDGKQQFPPLQLGFTPGGADAKREVPLPIPAQAPAGHYTLRLRATLGGVPVVKEFEFEVE